MPYVVKWSDDLCTGLAVIDRQHKTFFKLTNDLLEGSENDKKLILRAFDFLKSYIEPVRKKLFLRI